MFEGRGLGLGVFKERVAAEDAAGKDEPQRLRQGGAGFWERQLMAVAS